MIVIELLAFITLVAAVYINRPFKPKHVELDEFIRQSKTNLNVLNLSNNVEILSQLKQHCNLNIFTIIEEEEFSFYDEITYIGIPILEFMTNHPFNIQILILDEQNYNFIDSISKYFDKSIFILTLSDNSIHYPIHNYYDDVGLASN